MSGILQEMCINFVFRFGVSIKLCVVSTHIEEEKVFSSILWKKLSALALSELGAMLFEIAQSLFALERTWNLGAMALNEKKSEERQANWQNQI